MQRAIKIAIFAALLSSCSMARPDVSDSGPVEVGFCIGESAVKANVGEDGVSSLWEDGDNVGLWARNSAGSYTLSNRQFTIFVKDASTAIFTATLASPMAEDTYDYTVCYPMPFYTDGNTLKFHIPEEQDGRAGKGANVMISNTVKGGPLKPYEAGEGLSLSISHLVHLLKFYLPKGSTGLNGENVRRIEFSMPVGVAGDIAVDIASPTVITTFENQVNTMYVGPVDLAPSGTDKVFACAAIYPSKNVYGYLNITVYSDNYISELAPVDVVMHNFLPGHCTAVPLKVVDVHPYYSINYILKANNVGENIQKITFTAPSGCKLGDEYGNVFVYDPGEDIPLGFSGLFSYKKKEDFLTMSGKTVTVTFDSEHAESVQTLTLPNLSAVTSTTLYLTVPYLLYEDFSSVPTFSSNDSYATSSAGDKSAYSFLNGWSGGRVGGSAGKSIRIAGRRECGLGIDAHYPARVDSAPLSKLKKNTTVILEFDYGCDRNNTALGDVGQKIYVGYITDNSQRSSSDTSGTYPESFTSEETGCSWTNLSSHFSAEMTLPSGSCDRISWRNDPMSQKDVGSNTTSWLYIDNVKVKIKN